MNRAIRLGEYYLSHARAAFAEMGTDPDVEVARCILAWINRSEKIRFTERDAHQGLKSRFQRVDALRPGLRVLYDHNYIRERPQPPRAGAGRPASPEFEVNPAVKGNSEDIENSEDTGSDRSRGNFDNSEDCEDGSRAANGLSGSGVQIPRQAELVSDPHPQYPQYPQNSIDDLKVEQDEVPPAGRRCGACDGTLFWRSASGTKACHHCSPPSGGSRLITMIEDGVEVATRETAE